MDIVMSKQYLISIYFSIIRETQGTESTWVRTNVRRDKEYTVHTTVEYYLALIKEEAIIFNSTEAPRVPCVKQNGPGTDRPIPHDCIDMQNLKVKFVKLEVGLWDWRGWTGEMWVKGHKSPFGMCVPWCLQLVITCCTQLREVLPVLPAHVEQREGQDIFNFIRPFHSVCTFLKHQVAHCIRIFL